MLDEDTALFSSGIIDLLSVIDLVLFVEEQVGQFVPATDITLGNFDSVGRIVRYVSLLKPAESGAASR